MDRVREHVLLCDVRPQASCNTCMQMGSSRGRAYILCSARPRALCAMCESNELVPVQCLIRLVGGSM